MWQQFCLETNETAPLLGGNFSDTSVLCVA